MTQKQISITRALTEVKHLSDRINRATQEPFIGLARGLDTKKVCVNSPSSTVAAVETMLTSNYQSVNDMIKYRETLKRAIIGANATTTVVINNEYMTVAEAIEKKASIQFYQTLLANIRNQYATNKQKMEQGNTNLLKEIDEAVKSAYGNEKGKVEEDQYNAVAKPRMSISQLSLIDPNNVESVIKNLTDMIDGFNSEVDYVLSESNSRTMITV